MEETLVTAAVTILIAPLTDTMETATATNLKMSMRRVGKFVVKAKVSHNCAELVLT